MRVQVSKRGRARVLAGHLWIFQSDVQNREGVASGNVVEVRGPREDFLGQAFFSESSQIALRIITTEQEPVDDNFWKRRLTAALDLRSGIAPATTAYRWVHGEADGIPSLVVDRYGETLAVQTLSAGTDRLKQTFVRLWVELVQPSGIIERNDQKTRALEGLPLAKGTLYGEVPSEVVVQEEGIRPAGRPLGRPEDRTLSRSAREPPGSGSVGQRPSPRPLRIRRRILASTCPRL